MARIKEILQQNLPIVFLSLIIIILLWGYFSYIDKNLRQQIKENITTLREKMIERMTLEKVVKHFDELEVQYLKIKEELRYIEEQLPTEINMPQLIKDVTILINKYNIEFYSFVPSKQMQPEGPYCEKLPIKLDFSTNYQNFALFLESLGKMERVIHPLIFTISQEVGEEARKLKTIKINLEIAAYIYKG